MITKLVLYALLISGIALVATSLFTSPPRKIIVPVTVIKPPLKKGIIRLSNSIDGTYCSGVVVSPFNAITAAHCVTANDGSLYFPRVETHDMTGKDDAVLSIVAAVFADRDVAILKGDFSAFLPMKIATEGQLAPYKSDMQAMFSCGYPFGMPLLCMPVRYRTVKAETPHMWRVSNTLMPAMSGGPTIIYDEFFGDRVVAINTAYYSRLDQSEVAPIYDIITVEQGVK